LVPGREGKIILIPLQIALLALTATFMIYCATDQYRRSHRSWQAIVDRLSFARDSAASLDSYGAASPWTAFRDAGVMMEMADYAERHGREFDTASLETLRSTAIQLRFESLVALAGLGPVRWSGWN